MKRALLLLIPLLLTGLWWSAPWWAARIIEHQLTEQGFSGNRIEIETIGLHRLRIASLNASNQGKGIRISLRDPQADYDIAQLIDRQIERLQIGSLQISLLPTTGTGEGNPAPLLLASPALLFAQLPFAAASIDHIELQRMDAWEHPLLQLAGHVAYRSGALELMLARSTGPNRLQAEAMLDLDGRCHLNLSQGAQELIKSNCSITVNDQLMQMNGSLTADLAGIDNTLGRLAELPPHKLDGNVEIDWQAELPASLDWDHIPQRIKLKASPHIDVALSETDAPFALRAAGAVEIEQGAIGWKLDDGGVLRFGPQLATTLTLDHWAGSWSQSGGPMIEAGSSISLEHGTSGTVTIDALRATLAKAIHIGMNAQQEMALMQPTALRIEHAALQSGESRIDNLNGRIDLAAGSLDQLQGTL